MIRNWQPLAKCWGDDPSKYDWEDGDSQDETLARAKALCDGCPVLKECLKDALMPHNTTAVLRESRLGPKDSIDDIVQTSGVIRGGVPIGAGRERGKLRMRSVDGVGKLTLAAVDEVLPGFRGYCANCHEEMWVDSETRPRYGGICLSCAVRREEGELVGTSSGAPRLRVKACECCGLVRGKRSNGLCDLCWTVRRKPLKSSKYFLEPACSNCADMRRKEREALRDSG
ncbi:WhiB family transcriptional regulator [Tsukamurella paurometabola]|uniref:WhiB family transcriptional regulator n=1 Tax=Tsukamurella paurometabola TaxID=2061 RepID=A0ABS5NFS3_TSUPA|nr:WhiB family transcriptional regulator [Tsukamurella paurometabola]